MPVSSLLESPAPPGEVPTAAVIVAGGKGLRMNQPLAKQYLPLGRHPILRHTINTFESCDRIDQLVVVVPESDLKYCRDHILTGTTGRLQIALVAGGPERQESVQRGLAHVTDEISVVVIHDGVRPFIRPDRIARCIDEAAACGACILGLPVTDTLKQELEGFIQTTVDRSCIWRAQTPQAFRLALIREAHAKAIADNVIGTDDASLVERLGHPIKIIPGSRHNIKITTPEDLVLARLLITSEKSSIV
jgi:2-C-methyl-D-erythritol 4-phosphate cytidylyltransferase